MNSRHATARVLVTTDGIQYDIGHEDGPDRLELIHGISASLHYSDGGYHLIPWHMISHITYEADE